jgi:hypothetical protein
LAAAAFVAGSAFVVPRPSFAAATISFANAQNGLCIERPANDINHYTFILNICDGSSRQRFSLDVPDDLGVPIRHVSSGECLAQDLVGSTPQPEVVIGACAVPFGPQRWTLIFVGGGYRLQNVYSGDFLDGSSNLLRVRPRQANNNQLWRMVNN